ncbi:MAG: PhzF family phenazine biosynthesis protein [Synechococcales cyanobacterium T60_A2020_003]|nr:PhzF family phenazine biosynthesis protein [Synechococcales cyanobacterium T60_A2020_003]
MRQSIIQVDAFTDKPFAGNPAAVCVLDQPQSDDWMQNVAKEMNLSETAFLLVQESGYQLRWFTPAVEVPLCGHATLASAHVLWSEGYLQLDEVAEFHTKSGLLTAKRSGSWIELNFPSNPSRMTTAPLELSEALRNLPFKTVLENSLGYFVELYSEDEVRSLTPNFAAMRSLPVAHVIITSAANAGSEFDFVSRFFAPGMGIDEDPVTGAAHCCLAPFWRDRLQKDDFLAYQASRRGGVVKVHYDGGDRVLLSGQAVTVMRGELVTS